MMGVGQLLRLAPLVLALGVGLWGYSQSVRANRAEARANIAERQVVMHQNAQAELSKYLVTLETEKRRWEELSAEMEKETGSDQELSPYLRRVLDSLR